MLRSRGGDSISRDKDKELGRKKQVLKLLKAMCDNCFSPMQKMLFEQCRKNEKQINLMREVGELFIEEAVKEDEEREAKLLSHVLSTLIEFCYGSITEVKQFYSKWQMFASSLSKVIFRSYKLMTKSNQNQNSRLDSKLN